MRSIPAAALSIIREHEGFRAHAYRCPAGVWTIGYGFTAGVRPGDTITREQADARLAREIEALDRQIAPLLRVPPSDTQRAAMLSLAWNIGAAGFARSTVLKAHNRGDYAAAARAFALWNRAGGQVLTGLVRRRAAEAALYLQPTPITAVQSGMVGAPLPPIPPSAPEPMPQAVDEEKPLTQSRIATGGTITAVTSGLGAAAQVAGDVASIRWALGDWLPWVALAAALIAAGCGLWIVAERHALRKRGLA